MTRGSGLGAGLGKDCAGRTRCRTTWRQFRLPSLPAASASWLPPGPPSLRLSLLWLLLPLVPGALGGAQFCLWSPRADVLAAGLGASRAGCPGEPSTLLRLLGAGLGRSRVLGSYLMCFCVFIERWKNA